MTEIAILVVFSFHPWPIPRSLAIQAFNAGLHRSLLWQVLIDHKVQSSSLHKELDSLARDREQVTFLWVSHA